MWTINNAETAFPFEDLDAHTQELALLQLKQRSFVIKFCAQHHPWFYGLDLNTLYSDLEKIGFSKADIRQRTHFEHREFVSPNGSRNPMLEFDTDLDIANHIRFSIDLNTLLLDLDNGKRIFAKRPHTLPPITKTQIMPDSPKLKAPSKPSATKNVPRCPTCSSINIKKISNLQKAASVWAFGLLSQKVKRQFHCNNCGYEW